MSNDYKLEIIKAGKAEWVEISQGAFHENTMNTEIKVLLIDGSQVFFSGYLPMFKKCGLKYFAEKSVYQAMDKDRLCGFYRVVFSAEKYGLGFDGKGVGAVFLYNSVRKKFQDSGIDYDESDFSWIDDNPIEFPEINSKGEVIAL